VGQEFDIATGTAVRRGRVLTIAPTRVEFELGEEIPTASGAKVTLLLSIFKFDRMEWAIEKCTELGVCRIIPLIAARTESHLAAAAPKRLERWRRLAHQASEQSRRISPPEIADSIKLHEMLAAETGMRVVLSEAEQDLMLKNAVPSDSDAVTLAFGPEGGWKEQELAAFKAAGWKAASLGATILRAETAIIASVAVAAAMSASPQQVAARSSLPSCP
jgi:16S rRNA (uracil1498-N3)-methyltransferase